VLGNREHLVVGFYLCMGPLVFQHILLMSKSAIMLMALGRCASRGVLCAGAEVLAARAGMNRGVMLDAMWPSDNGSRVHMSGTSFARADVGFGGHGTLILSTEPTGWKSETMGGVTTLALE
jgi:hypothetical protein